ncbi:MAG TPA: hypothetical protein VF030_01245 [Solirubrobacterales bacterium]
MVGTRWSKSGIATLALAAALLTAAPAMGAEDDSKFDAFTLQGSNGYRILVFAVFEPGYGESSQVVVIAGRKGRGAYYSAPAVVTDKKIEADLGALGEIDVTLKLSGKKGVVHPKCAPKARVPYDKGTYVGTIEFRGEEGYTRVSTDRARFSYGPLRNIGCPSSVSGEIIGPHLPGALLWAHTEFEQGRVALRAYKNGPGKRVRIEAEIAEKRGRISILREVTSTYPAGSFDFAPDLRAALLDPPAPFSGTGFFRREAKPAARWTGNLSVDFPGRSNVSLTGDRFGVGLRHARYFRETRSPSRPNLSAWPSTKPSPIASATSLLLGPS